MLYPCEVGNSREIAHHNVDILNAQGITMWIFSMHREPQFGYMRFIQNTQRDANDSCIECFRTKGTNDYQYAHFEQSECTVRDDESRDFFSPGNDAE